MGSLENLNSPAGKMSHTGLFHNAQCLPYYLDLSQNCRYTSYMNRLLLTFQPARQKKKCKCKQFLYNIKAELKALLSTIKVAEVKVQQFSNSLGTQGFLASCLVGKLILRGN